MNNVIVTVKCKNKKETRDLELPTDIPAKHLSSLIAYALRLDDDLTSVTSKFHLYAEPLGRVLRDDETLEDAGVWDGSTLTIL
ncbi:EsaB/YukD family protein [Acetivibrio straminisolvens]|jgi:uncharacterized ubiquitin-like protein YukD|uniref:Ubiquitin-like domain-containing protein n=1 Tax=Acetivibrio straminisolvens JCM 21531 TaxID=1294263 RepID=W4V0D6_9FIRM|nr:EsaB/YukD family protein [Acetivibrio straminisolvens]GAE86935.1 hypothetical protein JCM21531_269 [Acetivibrio straminisolvens JCM 21531]